MVAPQGRVLRAEAPLSIEVVILGNGVAGTTAALRLRELLPEIGITVISEETELFFSRTALMYVYMRMLRFEDTVVHPASFYRQQRIQLVRDTIIMLDTEKKLLCGNSGDYRYDYLLLATGSRPRMPGIAGENLAGVQGLYSKQDLERLEAASRKTIDRAVVVGGGLIGVELAEMLKSRKIPVVFLVREPLYFSHILPHEEAQLVTEEVKRHVELRLNTTLTAIEGVSAVEAIVTSSKERIPCSFLGLTIGVEPRTELAQTAGLEIRRGIITDPFLRTSKAAVYAAGDAAEVLLPNGRHQVQQIWYSGQAQGKIAAENIAAAIQGKAPTPYDPGVYFNSARFFTLDYQTYGVVPANCDARSSLIWHDAPSRRFLRIAYDTASPQRKVVGFNALGIRLHHRVCEMWIQRQAPLERVLNDFAQALFDPEFSANYAHELRRLV